MKKYIFIGILGLFGAMSRYAIKSIDVSVFWHNFPINTLVINVIGCLFFSLIITLAYQTSRINADLRLGLTAGFLSAFTTFSTFCKEIVSLITNGFYMDSVLYILLSLLLGFMLSWSGAYLAKTFVILYRKTMHQES